MKSNATVEMELIVKVESTVELKVTEVVPWTGPPSETSRSLDLHCVSTMTCFISSS